MEFGAGELIKPLCTQSTLTSSLRRHLDKTYFTKHAGVEFRLVEEVNSYFAGDDTGITGISLPEELAIGSLLLGRQVEAGSS